MSAAIFLSNPLFQAQVKKAITSNQANDLIKLMTVWLDKAGTKGTTKGATKGDVNSGEHVAGVDRAMISALLRSLELADTQTKRDEILQQLLTFGKGAQDRHDKRDKHRTWQEWCKVSLEAVTVCVSVATLAVMIVTIKAKGS